MFVYSVQKTTANSSNVKQHRLMCFYNPTGNGGILRNRGAKRDNAFNHSLNGNCSDHELSSLSSDSYVVSTTPMEIVSSYFI